MALSASIGLLEVVEHPDPLHTNTQTVVKLPPRHTHSASAPGESALGTARLVCALWLALGFLLLFD